MLFDSFEAYDVQETRRISKTEGKAEGKAEAILEILSELGAVPEELQEKILMETNLDTLRALLKLAVKSKTIDDFRAQAER